MKKSDLLFALVFVSFFLPFLLFKPAADWFFYMTKEYSLLMSFVKFFFLATMGEAIAQRIKKGVYLPKHFGLLSRAFVWGLIGITIKMAFTIFATGTPYFLVVMGMEDAPEIILQSQFSWQKAVVSFSISTALNIMYAPVMMTFHKMTDTHIGQNNGRIAGFFRKNNVRETLATINWRVQWDFVFKKTIPLFWIPMQTITFLLPPEFRILFAALLGIALGVLLALASIKGKN